MPIPFECTGCGKKLKVKDDAAGKRIKCPDCQAVLTVPKPEVDEDDFLGGLDEAVKQEKKRPRAEPVEDDEDAEDYESAPRASSSKRRTKKTSTKSKSSSGSGAAATVFKAIGGGLFGLLVLLGIIGKVAKLGRIGGFGQTVSWQKFNHPKGGGSIDMPGTATLDVKQSTDPNAPVYTVTSRRFACSFTSALLPPMAGAAVADRTAAQMVFNEIKRAYMNAKPGSKFISEAPIQMGPALGIEMRFEVN